MSFIGVGAFQACVHVCVCVCVGGSMCLRIQLPSVPCRSRTTVVRYHDSFARRVCIVLQLIVFLVYLSFRSFKTKIVTPRTVSDEPVLPSEVGYWLTDCRTQVAVWWIQRALRIAQLLPT